jgi:transcriptional regulator with XRE-family HTH domain
LNSQKETTVNYAKVFRVLRAAHGYSQATLGSLLGLGASQISSIESGRRLPSLKVIEKLGTSMGISMPVLALLASSPEDLQQQDRQQLESLAVNLVKFLVSAREPWSIKVSFRSEYPALPAGRTIPIGNGEEEEEEGVSPA